MSELKPHFLQSEAWESFQNAAGFETFRKKGKNYEYMGILRPTSLGNYLFLPYGPTLANKKALKSALQDAITLAKSKKCLFIRIEPTIAFTRTEMRKFGANKSTHINPEHTWALDLTQTEGEIAQSIGKNKMRAYKNRAQKGISIRKSKNPADLEIFFKFYEDVAKKDNFQTNEREYLEKQLNFDFTSIYIAEFQPEKGKKIPIAATIMYTGDEACYYAYAGADYEFRKKEGGAILLTKMIYDAKAAGKKYFDFWGITTSNDPKDPWAGFTKFKKSFGGYQIDYAGTYDIPINRPKYALYSLLRPINKLKRKIAKK